MARPPWPGSTDLDDAAGAAAMLLPDPLAPLVRLAFNYRWSWLPGGAGLFAGVAPHRWERCGHNPVRLLREAPPSALRSAADDDALLARITTAETAVRADLDRPCIDGPVAEDRPVAFLCAEFGVHRSLPVYSGGLGVLAGDILKEASDLAVPMVAVGLMYTQGYFRQHLDEGGEQVEYWVDTDPWRLPMALVMGSDSKALTIEVPIRGRDVVAQIWRVDVGRVPLYLLDTDRPENSRLDRWISGRLYVSDASTRLAQYALLGIGGIRALQAMGIEPGVVHLNEGHAALAPLELARCAVEAGASAEEALAAATARTVFTTHTPVAAGNESYSRADATAALAGFAESTGLGADKVLRLGSTDPSDPGARFGLTQLGLRASRSANGVSRRHGEVARAMWKPLFGSALEADVPIGHVTNGVHVPTWLGSPMCALLDSHLGEGWMWRAADPATWEPVEDIPAADLWEARCAQRMATVEWAQDRSVADRLARGESNEYVEAAADTLDPDVLTLGFARRLATYKRLYLILQDPARALALLEDPNPVQVLLAGKAHPDDRPAQELLQLIFAMRKERSVGRRSAFIHDYDIGVAHELVSGCDVWVNLPRPPLEASGTSGMKSVLNGGLQLSVLDGWWAEAYDGSNGWAIDGDVDEDIRVQDARHADQLYDLLETAVIPAFYDRDADGIPQTWVTLMKASLRTLAPAFSATRMVTDYLTRVYPTP